MLLTAPVPPPVFVVLRHDRAQHASTEILRTRNRTWAMEVAAARNRLSEPGGVSYTWVRAKAD